MILFFLLYSLRCTAGLHLPHGEHFFRNLDSPFSSGQASVSDLMKNRVQSKQELNFVVKGPGKDLVTIPAQSVQTDFSLASILVATSSAELLEFPTAEAKSRASVSIGDTLMIENTSPYWTEVYHVKSQKRGWIPIHLSKVPDSDLGIASPIIDSLLKAEPNGKILTTIPKGTRLTPLLWRNDGWVQVKFKQHLGYLDARHLLTRADFAHWAWGPLKKWDLVSYRDGSDLVFKSGKRTPMSEIKAFHPSPVRAIITDASSELPLTSRIEIKEKRQIVWNQSLLKGHGLVWWKQQMQDSTDENALDPKSGKRRPTANQISTEELFQRAIFSYAMSNEQSLKGLVSAQGVWATEDGETWTKITQFENKDYPVATDKSGKWYIGPYVSSHLSHSYTPYIRWDRIAGTVQRKLNRSPQYMRLQKIEPLDYSRIKITVDTGIKRLQLTSRYDLNSWTIVE